MNTLKQLGVGVIPQSRHLWKVLFFIYLPVVLLFLTVGLLSRRLDDLTLSLLMRDIVTTGRLPFFTGLVPQLESVLWSASLTVCVIGWVVMKRRDGDAVRSQRFLLQFGLVTAVLMLDDIFLFHEEIAPDYLRIGEKYVIAVYRLMGIIFVFSNLNEILSSEYLILFLALGMYGTSIFLDAANLNDFEEYGSIFSEQFQIFLEDGFKFVGVATWLAYFARYGFQKIIALRLGSEESS